MDGQIDRWVEDRYGICLLDRQIANCLGFQLLCLVTRRTDYQRRTGSQGPPRPFEFPHLSTVGINGRSVMQIVRSYHIHPYPTHKIAERLFGTMSGNWDEGFSRNLGFMMGSGAEPTSDLPSTPRGRDWGLHPAVKGFDAGQVIAINGRAALVLSNHTTHAYHPYGPVVVAPFLPIVPRTGPSDPFTIESHGARLAWEWVHAIQPCTQDTLRSVAEPTKLSREAAQSARKLALQFIGTSSMTLTDSLATYLIRSQLELANRKLALPLARAQVPPPELDPRTIDYFGSSAGPLTGIMSSGSILSGSNTQLGGSEYVHLEEHSDLVDLCLHRSGSEVTLLVEPVDDNVTSLMAWIEGPDGELIQQATVEGFTKSRVASLSLGKIAVDQPIDATIMLWTNVGSEELRIHHVWRSPLA